MAALRRGGRPLHGIGPFVRQETAMPRAKGQCDPLKTEAILDAAARQIRVCGAMGSIDEIARQAGVSKQTIYTSLALGQSS